MNQQIPLFMPMYPGRIEDEINRIKTRLNDIEERLTELEKTKLVKLDNPKKEKDFFKEGYIL